MNDGSASSNENTYSFLLNMQIIADGLMDQSFSIELSSSEDKGRLSQIGFYHRQETLEENCVYLVSAEALPQMIFSPHFVSLLVIGKPPADYYNENISMIVVRDSLPILELYDIVLGIFERNRQWNEEMQNVLNQNGTLEELCKTAFDYFQNPLFIHNPQFYVMACPVHQDNMAPWQEDERTGLPMLSAELIDSFKVNPVYFETLDTDGVQLFPMEQMGYRVLYINLRDETGRYEGRICIDELNTPLKKGQFLAMAHLARMVCVLLKRRNPDDRAFLRPFETRLIHLLEERECSDSEIQEMLELSSWDRYDTYVCLKLRLNRRDMEIRSVVNTCNHIELTLQQCRAIAYQDNILIILNLTKNGKSLSDCINDLVFIIREGLFITGYSNLFHDFAEIPYAYQQASIALSYGNRKDPTIWIHSFRDYVMNYVYDRACAELPVQFICSDKVLYLLDYDRVHKSNLYKTLDCYIKNNLNAEQSAKDLYIHRSTLFYRLKRIKELTEMDFSSEKERYYLSFSLNLINENSNLNTLSNIE